MQLGESGVRQGRSCVSSEGSLEWDLGGRMLRKLWFGIQSWTSMCSSKPNILLQSRFFSLIRVISELRSWPVHISQVLVHSPCLSKKGTERITQSTLYCSVEETEAQRSVLPMCEVSHPDRRSIRISSGSPRISLRPWLLPTNPSTGTRSEPP